MALLLATIAMTGTIIGTQSAHAGHHGHHGHHGSHVSTMSVTGNATALAGHSTAFLYGFGLGKNAGLRGYYDVMNECSNRPYLSTNVTGAIKNFTQSQQVDDCDSGYDQGWNKYCHIGLANHPDVAAVCPGTPGPKTEIKSTQY